MSQTLNGILDVTTRHTPQVATATLALDGGTVADVFTIAGGPIEVLGLWMHITEAVSANACAFKWQIDPTIGASSTDLCATADIISAALGDVFYILGPSASVLQKAANGTAVALSCTARVFLPPGGIDAVFANSDPTTGIAAVYLAYRRMTLTSVVTS
jgi:hypothetical protein